MQVVEPWSDQFGFLSKGLEHWVQMNLPLKPNWEQEKEEVEPQSQENGCGEEEAQG